MREQHIIIPSTIIQEGPFGIYDQSVFEKRKKWRINKTQHQSYKYTHTHIHMDIHERVAFIERLSDVARVSQVGDIPIVDRLDQTDSAHRSFPHQVPPR